MRLVSFVGSDGTPRPGVLSGDIVIDLLASQPDLPTSIRELLEADCMATISQIAQSSEVVTFKNARLVQPVLDPKKIICVGLNYRDHAIESGMAIPEEPVIFSKFSTSVIGPNEPIVIPKISPEVDYEAELVVVIGRRAERVREEDAWEYVAGYTIGNDVSARDWQLRKPGGQWILGKSFTTFAPIGPTLVTKDEIQDPHELSIELRLNGRKMQYSSTNQLIFRIDFLISYLSKVVPLEPGDLIFTGTPPGVGFARNPPIFLKPNDLCEIEIEGLGVLSNRCVEDSDA